MSEEEFWIEIYKDDAIGYSRHLDHQKMINIENEKSERASRERVSDLFSEETLKDVGIHINRLTREELLDYRRQLKRVNDDVEARYHSLLDLEIFAQSPLTLNDLLSQSSWDDVKVHLLKNFTKQENMIEGFEHVFDELKRLTPMNNKDSLVISMEYIEMEDGYSIFGLKPKDMDKYALDFVPWEEWLGYFVSQQDVDKHGVIMIIAHCLWEMTFDGFTQNDVRQKLSELLEIEGEIDGSHEKE